MRFGAAAVPMALAALVLAAAAVSARVDDGRDDNARARPRGRRPTGAADDCGSDHVRCLDICYRNFRYVRGLCRRDYETVCAVVCRPHCRPASAAAAAASRRHPNRLRRGAAYNCGGAQNYYDGDLCKTDAVRISGSAGGPPLVCVEYKAGCWKMERRPAATATREPVAGNGRSRKI